MHDAAARKFALALGLPQLDAQVDPLLRMAGSGMAAEGGFSERAPRGAKEYR